MITTAEAARFPFPSLADWPSGVWLFAGSASIVLGIWPDIGAFMLGLFVVPAAVYFHRFWTIDDPAQRRTQALAFYRNVEIMGASLVMFGLFGWVGHGLRFAMTGSLTRWGAGRITGRAMGGLAPPRELALAGLPPQLQRGHDPA